MSNLIVKKINGNICHIVLNRPAQSNALSSTLMKELDEVLDYCEKDQSIRSLLISGEGKGFCGGADIEELSQLKDPFKYSVFGQGVFRKLETLGKPSLAAIHGFAHGGGCELAMATTIRIATVDTIFSQPEIKLGLVPAFGGTERLERLIGKGRAIDICLTGRKFTADEALKWGFLSETMNKDSLLQTAIDRLTMLNQLSPSAVTNIINMFAVGNDREYYESTYFSERIVKPNGQEGINAFLEKRSPCFNNE